MHYPLSFDKIMRMWRKLIRDQMTDLMLREERGVTRNPAAIGGHDEGFIEPGDQCGVLPLVVVRADDATPLASAAVEVRSVKLNYREHYRGMLDYIATRYAGLLLSGARPVHTCSIRATPVTGSCSRSTLVFMRCFPVWEHLPFSRVRMALLKAWTICAGFSTM